MHPPLSARTDSLDDLENQYREHYLAADARQTSIAIGVWLIPVVFFAYPDYLLFGLSSKFAGLLALRLAFCLFSLYTIFVMRKVATPRDYDHAFLRWAAFAVAAVLFFNYSWAHLVPPTGVITILILFSSYIVFPSRFSVRIVPPVALSIGNIVLQWQIAETVSPYSLFTMMMAVIMVNVLGIIFSAILQKHRRIEFKVRLEENRIKAELSRLASVDELTGVFNRRKLIELASEEFERFAGSSQQFFAVLMIDIDHFKKFNDNYGHEAGDRILAEFASYVAHTVHEENIWGRIGGEEFVLVLPNLSCEAALLIAERLRCGLHGTPVYPRSEPFAFTISIGITEARAQDQSFGDVLQRADKALYCAKQNGRNRAELL